MKFYDVDGNVLTSVNFGYIRIGASKEVMVFAENESSVTLIDIEFSVKNAEVSILKAPRNLKSKAREQLILKWVPRMSSEFGLKCDIDWKAEELRGERA